MTQLPWQASADLSALSARAALLQQLRHFLQQRNLLEVDVPALGRAAVTDPHIDSIAAQVCDETFYLQTSPEFYMKRLLASGSGDIYSLAKAFRNGEAGRKHNPEFTMLEWYRLGWTDHQLMDEVSELLQHCLSLSSIERISYRSLFQRHLGVDPHRASVEQLKSLANQHGEFDWPDSDRDTWLDLLMTHVIEPNMGEGLMLVHDFPASQAALARLHKDSEGELIARRFEAYVGGVELANGYWELCDSEEQAARLERDLSKRAQLNLPQYPSDQCLVAALEAGLPECAGVALGVDRLLMLVSGISDIRQLMAFPFDRA
ncbi:MAG: elongation factor P lysine(34) lysyltransferase [Cellvibrionaceae bacterium]|nr:elongation factor P lysine(34) lysyltransferase [Cellvibrionaceae bacterium]